MLRVKISRKVDEIEDLQNVNKCPKMDKSEIAQRKNSFEYTIYSKNKFLSISNAGCNFPGGTLNKDGYLLENKYSVYVLKFETQKQH